MERHIELKEPIDKSWIAIREESDELHRADAILTAHNLKNETVYTGIRSKSTTNAENKNVAISENVSTNQEVYPQWIIEEHLDYLKLAIRLAEEQKWSEFKMLLDSPAHEQVESLKLFLIQALIRNAPSDIILDILNRGAPLDEDILDTLTKLNRTEQIEFLRNYGLPIDVE